ncbi:hypothetical protein N9004_01320 [Pirellulales bacterium]|nr:hypothetical protein [bacterium]MDB4366087.1 hypothetical protein [Pirellulales bacterium]MDB4475374.1 hypothetical protein [Pirellulales bacterium]
MRTTRANGFYLYCPTDGSLPPGKRCRHLAGKAAEADGLSV